MSLLRSFFAVLTLAVAPSLVLAQTSPEEHVNFAIYDGGETLEIEWFFDEGAHFWGETVEFSVSDPSVTLLGGVVPDDAGTGLVFAESFTTIPYSIEGDRPESIVVTIKASGATPDGEEFTDAVWMETVQLRASATETRPLDFNALTNSSSTDDREFPPPEEVFFPDVQPLDGNTVEIIFRVEPGFYLYRHRMSVRALSDTVLVERMILPEGKLKTDEFFGEQEVYYDELVGRVALLRTDGAATDVDIEIGYQGCADAGLCYLPLTEVITVSLPETRAIADVTIPDEPQPTYNPAGAETVSGAPDAAITTQPRVSEQSRLAAIITDAPLWVAIGLFFVAGLGLAFTPCVLPMIPILSGIIAGAGDNVTSTRGFMLAFIYVLGMSLVYTLIGVIAGFAGEGMGAVLQQPVILSLFAILFVLLALAMFGVYDLQMPSSVQSKIATISGNQESGTTVGAFIMGALSAIVVTACVAPAIVAAVAVIADAGATSGLTKAEAAFRGGVALFSMSWGMGAPLLLVGVAGGRLLPKAGPWMVAVKSSFGFLFLGLAVWMLSRFVDGTITMTLWATLVFIGGVFMGGLTSLTSESSVAQKLGKGFGVLAILYGLILFLGALTGGTNPLKPLATVSFGGGGAGIAAEHEEEHLEFVYIKTVDDFERELAAANAAGKTVMLDFYADWCVSCIEMENYTFVTDEVQSALSNTVPLQADVTRNDAEDKALIGHFLEAYGERVFGPPTILFFDTDGQRRPGYTVVGFMNSEEFSAHVREAFGLTTPSPSDELVTAR
ncbi:MAG: protein-disulfide reductase DsbD [Woeseiaceae bacterium]|nr:protein-disulfide reductase DsbD [Woeseiaceae bacterium]